MSAYRLTRRVKFPTHWPAIGVNPKTPSQRLSPTPYAFENLCNSHCFIATESLYVGPDKCQWSQVYYGSLTSPSFPSVNYKALDNIVLKVFSSSSFPLSDSDPRSKACLLGLTSANSYRYTDELMAWTEVHAYSKLFLLQGTVIPHFIDAFMVRSPESDQESIGIAMSHIQGQPIVARCRELGSEVDSDMRWYPIALQLFRRVHQVHQLGIIGLDVRGANILVVGDPNASERSASGSSSSYSVMLFDFAFSRPRSFPTSEEQNRHRVSLVSAQDVDNLQDLLLEICGDDIGVRREASYDYGGPGARRWAFLQWARRECPHEPWVCDWWSQFNCLEP
ncbi:hypothetical protein BDZ97DRAFT_1847755 [Flammula alnicola]|nr:hypothetical protein BDZ97DRAFT_1847755 [Flammula alnicola]